MIMEANMRLLNEQEENPLWKQVINKVGESEFDKIEKNFATIGDTKGVHIMVGQSVAGGEKEGYDYAIGVSGKIDTDKISTDELNNILSKLDQSKRQKVWSDDQFEYHPLTDVDSVVNVIKELKNKLGL